MINNIKYFNILIQIIIDVENYNIVYIEIFLLHKKI